MPAAANLTGLKPVAPESAPGVAPAAELFAALVAGIGPAADAPGPVSETEGDQPEGEEAAVDVSILLPMLDQQRAAAPTAIAVALPTAAAGNPIEPAATLTVAGDAGRELPASIAPKAASDALAQKSAVPQPPANHIQAATVEPHQAAPAKPIPDARTGAPAQAPAQGQPNVATQSIAAVLANPPAPAQPGKPVRTVARAADAPVTGVVAPAKAAAAPHVAAPVAPVSQLPPISAGADQPVSELAATTQPGREAAPSVPLSLLGASQLAPSAAAPAPAQNLGAALANQVLDLARGGEWVDQLARDIARSAAADGTMRFRLAPETLGELRVEITQSDRGAHVRLHVSSEAAQQALAEASSRLVQEARAQGVRIAEAEVSLGGGQSQGREAGRQGPSEQPLRSLRNPAPNEFTGGERSGHARTGRTDLYA